MKDLMLDLETLGTHNNSVITQIGACYFDRYSGDIGKTLCVNISINSCLESGLSVDGGAIKFWLEHEPTFLKEAVPLSKALQEFRDFCHKKAIIWSHATFDAVLLLNAYNKIGQGSPFSYRSIRDIRTLTDLARIKRVREEGVDPKTHNALEDCIYQVGYCVECFNSLKLP